VSTVATCAAASSASNSSWTARGWDASRAHPDEPRVPVPGLALEIRGEIQLGVQDRLAQAAQDRRGVLVPGRRVDVEIVAALAVGLHVVFDPAPQRPPLGALRERGRQRRGRGLDHDRAQRPTPHRAAELPQPEVPLDGLVVKAGEEIVGIERAGVREQIPVRVLEVADGDDRRGQDEAVQLPQPQQPLLEASEVPEELRQRGAVQVERVELREVGLDLRQPGALPPVAELARDLPDRGVRRLHRGG
jgi:hypothetical protein